MRPEMSLHLTEYKTDVLNEKSNESEKKVSYDFTRSSKKAT